MKTNMKTFHEGGRGSTLFPSMKFIPLFFLSHERPSLREDEGDDDMFDDDDDDGDDMFDDDDDVNDDDMFDGCQGRKQARKGEVAASSCSQIHLFKSSFSP